MKNVMTTDAGAFSNRQIKILDVLERGGYTPCGIGDLVDDDFCDLLSRNLVDAYMGVGASRMCHITDEGRLALKNLRDGAGEG